MELYNADPEAKKAGMREWAKSNPEKVKAGQKALYERNREARIAYAIQRKLDNPERTKDWNLRKCYGISLADYNAMLESQGGCCAICGQSHGVGRSGVLQVDHCHATGRVRGLLCGNCNMSLGGMKDDPALLRKGAEYLEKR